MSTSTYMFGRRFKNRLFVGGLPANATPQELAFYFSNFGAVVEAKIIVDENQIPKGYGFITFQSEHDVKRVTEMGTLFLRNKKLNVGPAVRKEGPSHENIKPELVVVPEQQMKGEYYLPMYPTVVQYPVLPSCPEVHNIVPYVGSSCYNYNYYENEMWTLPAYTQQQPTSSINGYQPRHNPEHYKPRKTRKSHIAPRFRQGRSTENTVTGRAN